MQQSPHHPPCDLGIDSQQPETIVIVFQLIHYPLANRLPHYLDRRGSCSRYSDDSGGSRGWRLGCGDRGAILGSSWGVILGWGGGGFGVLLGALQPDTGAVQRSGQQGGAVGSGAMEPNALMIARPGVPEGG